MNLIDDSVYRQDIIVTRETTEEDVLEKFNLIKASFEARKRQRILETAGSLVASYCCKNGVATWGTRPTAKALQDRLEQLPPHAIEIRLRELEQELELYKSFPDLYKKKIIENLPCNTYGISYSSKEEAFEQRKGDAIETVAKATAYIKELVTITRKVLLKKVMFVKEHEAEVPSLVKDYNTHAKRATILNQKIRDYLKKNTCGDESSETRAVIGDIIEHKKLDRLRNEVLAKLVLYRPDNPTDNLLNFPWSNYHLPSWLERKVRNAEVKT